MMDDAQPAGKPVEEGNIAFPQRWNSLSEDGDYREDAHMLAFIFEDLLCQNKDQ